jgi:hypothetical protein
MEESGLQPPTRPCHPSFESGLAIPRWRHASGVPDAKKRIARHELQDFVMVSLADFPQVSIASKHLTAA